MEQEDTTTSLIVSVQLPPRQRSLPVVSCEDGDDASFHSLHPMEQLHICLTGLTSLLLKNSFSLVRGVESSRLVLLESGVTSTLDSEGRYKLPPGVWTLEPKYTEAGVLCATGIAPIELSCNKCMIENLLTTCH